MKELLAEPMKECLGCPGLKPLDAFSKQTGGKFGRKAYCKECRKQHAAQDRKDDPQSHRAALKRYRDKKPHIIRDWQKANPEKLQAAKRKYRKTERGRLKRLLAVQLHRARKHGAAGHTSVEQFQARWDFYGGCCWMCRRPATEMDHVIAIGKGGSHWPANLRPACKSCNRRKNTKSWREFRSAVELAASVVTAVLMF